MNQDPASQQTGVIQEILPFLRNIAFLAQVPEKEVEAVIPRLRVQSYPAGSVIIQEGDPGDACFIVASGSVDIVTRDLIGQEVALATLGAVTCSGRWRLGDTDGAQPPCGPLLMM